MIGSFQMKWKQPKHVLKCICIPGHDQVSANTRLQVDKIMHAFDTFTAHNVYFLSFGTMKASPNSMLAGSTS